MSHIVYKHITPSGKIYIGQTNSSIEKRAGKDGVLYKPNIYFYNAIQKYGWDNIEHIVVCDNISKKEADWLERYLIAYYNTIDSRYGYNLTKGGDGVLGRVLSKESIEKIREGNKGRHNSVATEFKKGHTFTPEMLAKMSKAKKGKNYLLRLEQECRKQERAICIICAKQKPIKKERRQVYIKVLLKHPKCLDCIKAPYNALLMAQLVRRLYINFII